MNIIQRLEQDQIQTLTAKNPLPEFAPGDSVRVWVKVIEGSRERNQAFEGVCIARKHAGINSAFTVRKISYGEGVERLFPLYSPNIRIELVRRGRVRRAKLYYLRDRRGKSARIAEKTDYNRQGIKVKLGKKSQASNKPVAEPVESPVESQVSPETSPEQDAPKSE